MPVPMVLLIAALGLAALFVACLLASFIPDAWYDGVAVGIGCVVLTLVVLAASALLFWGAFLDSGDGSSGSRSGSELLLVLPVIVLVVAAVSWLKKPEESQGSHVRAMPRPPESTPGTYPRP